MNNVKIPRHSVGRRDFTASTVSDLTAKFSAETFTEDEVEVIGKMTEIEAGLYGPVDLKDVLDEDAIETAENLGLIADTTEGYTLTKVGKLFLNELI